MRPKLLYRKKTVGANGRSPLHLSISISHGPLHATSGTKKFKHKNFWRELVNKWGEVWLRWDGGFEKLNQRSIIPPCDFLEEGGEEMSPSDSLINPERFDELVRIQRIFGSAASGIDYPLLKALEKMVQSKYPCSLVTLKDTRRLWMNEKLIEQGLEVDIQEGIGRDLTGFWLPGDLEELVKKVSSCDLTTGFDWRYQGAIFPPAWGKFYSHFDRVESIAGICRLTTFKEFEQIPNPLINP